MTQTRTQTQTHRLRTPHRRHRVLLMAAAGAAAAVVALPTLATAPAGAASSTVSLVAYSTPKPAYGTLIAAFNKTKAGKGVTVSQSYGASGTQATAVADGLPADVVNFSLEPDMDKVVKAGLVSPRWDRGPTKGMVTNSVVALIVRKGNPKHIHSWADLVKPGVKVVTPNPFSSGSAQWNLLAGYGAQRKLGKSPAAANAYLAALLQHTVAQPSSASEALQTFLGGEGDVLLGYEDDALYAKRQGEPIKVLIPQQDILIQNPIAVVKTSKNLAGAKAFVSYLLSPAAQRIWGQQGYRPVLPAAAKQFSFPQPKALFTINYLGGWTQARDKFFDPATGVVTKIEQGLGVSTAKG